MKSDTKLVSMKLPPRDKADAEVLYPSPSGTREEYPYGLRINLGNEQLAQLGITKLAELGAEFTITAKAEVCSRNEYESEGDKSGPRRNLELQITSLAVT